MRHAVSGLYELFIWPHAGCNHRCVSCDIRQDCSRRELAAEDIARWADEWQRLGVKEVILTGGEPLMHRDLADTVRTAQKLGIQRFSFIPADVTSGAFNRAGGWDADRQEDLVISREALPELNAEPERVFTECADAFEGGMIQESPDHLRSYVGQYYAAFHGSAGYPGVACNLPWGSAVVEVDGTVRPCFFQPGYGNLHEAGSLDAVLNSPTAVKWRAELDVATNETCQRCVCFRTVDLPKGSGRV